MCGFAGFLDLRRHGGTAERDRLAGAMADCLAARGPDDRGTWTDDGAGIALGFRRLAIIDTSPAGHQPMLSASGRLAMVYNGEVYNYRELRAELIAAGHGFTGHSDTEVILQACEVWGVRAAVERLIGMFSIALWDREARRLYLIRDRMGIKPLFWGRVGDMFAFASQPKAFTPLPDWRPAIDPDGLAAYLRLGYVPAPGSLFQGIRKLRPGDILTVAADGTVAAERYWDLRTLAPGWAAARRPTGDAEAEAALTGLIDDAVQRRMIADVPLGAFLSGGIDSSVVVAAMQRASPVPVRTFSIGSTDPAYDESAAAAAVARHLGTAHTTLTASPEDTLALVPELAEAYDEPLADSSQIPALLVSRLARRHVTVALSGDGGDEVFAGYRRHQALPALQRRIGWMPRAGRRAVAGALRLPSPALWDRAFALAGRGDRLFGDRLHKVAGVLDADGTDARYRRLVALWPETAWPGRTPLAIVPEIDDPTLEAALPLPLDRLQLYDQTTYLPDDILAKVDRASMAVGLEARVPLLDHRIVAFAWGLSADQRVRAGRGKFLLRRVLARSVPAALTDRPKQGFSIPLAGWLRGPLRDWAETLLAPQALAAEGCLDPAPIRRRWDEHLAGRRNWDNALWAILMLQAWRVRWTGLRI